MNLIIVCRPRLPLRSSASFSGDWLFERKPVALASFVQIRHPTRIKTTGALRRHDHAVSAGGKPDRPAVRSIRP
jgi:hypothetical protein